MKLRVSDDVLTAQLKSYLPDNDCGGLRGRAQQRAARRCHRGNHSTLWQPLIREHGGKRMADTRAYQQYGIVYNTLLLLILTMYNLMHRQMFGEL